MYSRNDYWAYLDSSSYLSHHGILGMKWGVRRYQPYSVNPRKGGKGGKEIGLAKKNNKLDSKNEKLASKKEKLSTKKAKIDAKRQKYQEKLESPEIKKAMSKMSKAQARVDASDSSLITKRANSRLKRGKDIGLVSNVALRKQANAERALARASKPVDKLNAKIADLDYKSTKIDHLIKKTDMKMTINNLNKQRNSELGLLNKAGIENYKANNKTGLDIDKQINNYWDDQVRSAKGRKKKQKTSEGPKYDRELIEISLSDAEDRTSRKKR